jgi:hypothetical protein
MALGRLYTVEAWKDHACAWFRTGNQARTVVRRAQDAAADYRLDGGNDRVIVYREGDPIAVAEYSLGAGWMHVRDSRLQAIIEAE